MTAARADLVIRQINNRPTFIREIRFLHLLTSSTYWYSFSTSFAGVYLTSTNAYIYIINLFAIMSSM